MAEDEDAQRPIPIWLGLLFALYGLAVLVGFVCLCYRWLA
jgi:hypothetical protein